MSIPSNLLNTINLDFVAIERDPDYHAASLDRLASERSQLLLPL